MGASSFEISNNVQRWDTSSLPNNATVLNAYMICDGDNTTANIDSLSLIGDWLTPTLSASDYVDVITNPNAVSATSLSNFSAGPNGFVLGLSNPSNVNLTGYTGLRLGVTQRAADAAPTGNNTFSILALDGAGSGRNAGRLVVDYVTPADATQVKYFYLLGSTQSGTLFNAMQDGGTLTPGMMSPAQGWVTSNTALGNSAEFDSQTERAATAYTSQSTTPKPGVPDNTTLGNGWVSPAPLYGVFTTGSFTLALAFRSASSAWDGRGDFRWRVFKSTSQTGSNPTEITSSTQVTSATTAALSTSNMWTLTSSFSISSPVVMLGEYLFITLAHEITTAGTTGTTKDVNLAVGGSSTLTTPPMAGLPEVVDTPVYYDFY